MIFKLAAWLSVTIAGESFAEPLSLVPLGGKLYCDAASKAVLKQSDGAFDAIDGSTVVKRNIKRIKLLKLRLTTTDESSSSNAKKKIQKLKKTNRLIKKCLSGELSGDPDPTPTPTAVPTPEPTGTPVPSPTPIQAFDPNIQLSRASGVAPLAVFMDGEVLTSGMFNNDFLNAEFETDFDSNSVDPIVASATHGFLSAHVYREGGEYAVSMSVVDAGLEQALAEPVLVTVVDPDVAFLPPNGETYCFSTGVGPGNFTGCPSSDMSHWISTTDFGIALGFGGSHRRLLFRRGDTWNRDSSSVTGVSGPMHIGAFPNPATNDALKPTLHSDVTTFGTILDISGSNDLRVTDFHIQGPWTSSVDSSVDGIGAASSSNVLLQYLLIEGTGNLGVYLGAGVNAATNLTLADSEIANGNQYGVFGTSNHFAALRNYIHNMSYIQHGIRIQTADRTVICGNTIVDNQSATSITLRGNNDRSVVCNNTLDTIMSFTPQNNTSEEYVTNILAEGNRMHQPSGQNELFQGIRIAGRDMTLRNNIFSNVASAFSIGDHPLVGGSARIRMFNNSYFNSVMGPGVEHHYVLASSGSEAVEFFNNIYQSASDTSYGSAISFLAPINELSSDYNIFYFPNQDPSWDFAWIGSPRTFTAWQAMGFDTHSIAEDPLFAVIDFADDDCLLPASNSPALDSGMPMSLRHDARSLARPVDGDGNGTAEIDRGAVERQ